MVELRFREIDDECQNCHLPLNAHKRGAFKEAEFSSLANRRGAFCPPDAKTTFVPVRVLELEGLTEELEGIKETIRNDINNQQVTAVCTFEDLRILVEQIKKGEKG